MSHISSVDGLRRQVRPYLVPDFSANALTHHAAGLVVAAKYPEAYEVLQAAITAQPKLMSAHNEMGNCLKQMGRHEDAIKAYEYALSLSPGTPEIYMNLGSCLIDVGCLQEAADRLVTAITMGPYLDDARWNLAITLLSSGQLHEGWRVAEQRWKINKFRRQNPGYSASLPRWEGEKGARVLVWGEQGMGERIMYAPMVRDLVAYGCDVFLEADERIAPMFRRSFPEVEVITAGERLDPGEATHHIAQGDLAPYFRDSFEDFPRDWNGRPGYLRPAWRAARRAQAATRATGKKTIGICWRSGNSEHGGHKSMTLWDLLPLFELPDVQIVNLQYGDTAEERANFKAVEGHEVVDAGIDLKANIEGLAALISGCDVVVSVSNTHAHLAAAMGVPTWVLLPKYNARFWYWFLDRSDSPWYPSARLYRQERHGHWGPLIDQVTADLAALPIKKTDDQDHQIKAA